MCPAKQFVPSYRFPSEFPPTRPALELVVISSAILQVPHFTPKSVRHAIRYYKQLSYHRSVVLEGVRRCAMRNRNYWYETQKELSCENGKSPTIGETLDRINIRQAQTAQEEFELVARMSDASRRDSRLEAPEKGYPFSRAHDVRRLLESRLTSQILHSIWDIYLCLLYVELDSYKKRAKSTPDLRCPTIDVFLKDNSAFISWLKSFRNKFLHPISELTTDDLAVEYVCTLSDSSSSELSHVFALQGMIDCHIAAVREGIFRVRGRDWVSSQLGSVPPDTNYMSRDERVGLGTFASAPNLSFLLCAGLASRMLKSEPLSRTPAMNSLPERERTAISNMLLRSLILISEWEGTVDIVKLFNSEDPKTLSLSQNAELSKDGGVPRSLQEFNNILALDRVAVALLHEPLRIYLKLARSSESYGLSSSLEGIPQGKAMSALRSFRNVVFHVQLGSENPALVESRWLEFCEIYHSTELLSRLLEVFGYSHFCPLDSVWGFPLRSSRGNDT